MLYMISAKQLLVCKYGGGEPIMERLLWKDNHRVTCAETIMETVIV